MIPLFLLALAAAGCGVSGGPASDDRVPLSEGAYSFSLTQSPTDTCWPASETWPPLITTEVGVETPDRDAFRIVPPAVVQWLLPPLDGARDGDALAAAGAAVVPYDASCSLSTSASFEGSVTADDAFAGRIDVGFDATAASDCSALAGTVVSSLVPFPVLDDPASGACAVSVLVEGAITAPE
jgi:hypothetical protein